MARFMRCRFIDDRWGVERERFRDERITFHEVRDQFESFQHDRASGKYVYRSHVLCRADEAYDQRGVMRLYSPGVHFEFLDEHTVQCDQVDFVRHGKHRVQHV